MSALPHPAQVVERILAASSGPCLATVEETHGAEVRFANNTATTNGMRHGRRVTAIRVLATGQETRAGVATESGEVDEAELVAAAEREANVADDAFELVEGDVAADFDDEPSITDMSVLSAVLGDLAGVFQRAEGAGAVMSGFAEHQIVTTYLGSSTGLRLRHAQPTGALHLVGRADARSAWAASGASSFDEVRIEALEERVRRGLEWADRQLEVAAGRHEVILPPEAVSDFMAFMVWQASGREAEEGRTVFSRPGGGTRLGERLSELPFQLRSDPAEPGLECQPFVSTTASTADVSVFDNGLSLGRTAWIDEGRLTHLRYHRAGAARSGVPPAPPVDNLVLSLPGAAGTLDDLVSRTERGLLLTCLWYIRVVDPKTLLFTGLTRDGVYVVEDGRVVGAANNFRFNESPVDLLSRATEASVTERALGREFGEWMNRAAMPALRIPDFNMSTVSAAS